MKIENPETDRTRPVITTNKVVARFLDGRALKGWCHAFRQEKPSVRIESVDRSATHEIAWEDLKALFFVREFEGLDKGLGDMVSPQTSPVSSLGQHVQVEFLDGEVIQGYAETLKKEKKGFFITPLDPESNNLRIFVPHSALRTLRIAPKLGETMVNEGMVHRDDMATALKKQTVYRESKLGEVLITTGMSSPEDVERALHIQRMVSRRIGSILVQADVLSEEDLEKALDAQKQNRNKRLGEILVEMGLATSQAVSLALALKYRLPYVDPSIYSIDPEASALIKEETVRSLRFIPIAKKEDELTIAIDDPINFEPRDYVQSAVGLKVKEVISTPEAIQEAIDKVYRASLNRKGPNEVQGTGGLAKRKLKAGISGLTHSADEIDPAKLLDAILRTAVEKNATDIHLNPDHATTAVSYRIEGVLHREKTLDSQLHPLLVSRIKTMGNMNISERNLPQEGRTRLRVGERVFDMRVSSLPALWGESIVIRLIEKSAPVMKLDDLGFFPEDLVTLRSLLNRPQGMILVSGPAASGKSTTLYSLLQEPEFEKKNIITIEDRIEHEFCNATQIQIKPDIDLTYANTLRQSLKHDPDVILLGEIRDPETARLSVHAGLSGHILLAAIQAPSSSESLGLLLDMGIEPYLVASSLVAIVSQRLVRMICTSPGCRQEDHEATKRLRTAPVAIEFPKGMVFWKGTGCDACRNGYEGRTIIYELMVVDAPIKRAIVERRSPKELLAVAKEYGMRTMSETALLKAKAGITTAEQIISLSLPDMR